jgi:hypothetical protein
MKNKEDSCQNSFHYEEQRRFDEEQRIVVEEQRIVVEEQRRRTKNLSTELLNSETLLETLLDKNTVPLTDATAISEHQVPSFATLALPHNSIKIVDLIYPILPFNQYW